ncbi:hypothetical protein F5Y16DRAFT_273135 [Xylariaceae sp. FL0255]|nr:hypothetical protein F5Y16DRAFT_273135 [Xylariaceae sp. FL0255]
MCHLGLSWLILPMIFLSLLGSSPLVVLSHIPILQSQTSSHQFVSSMGPSPTSFSTHLNADNDAFLRGSDPSAFVVIIYLVSPRSRFVRRDFR